MILDHYQAWGAWRIAVAFIVNQAGSGDIGTGHRHMLIVRELGQAFADADEVAPHGEVKAAISAPITSPTSTSRNL